MNCTPTRNLLGAVLMIGCIFCALNAQRSDGAAPDFSPKRRLGQFVARSGFGTVGTDVDLPLTTEESDDSAVFDLTAVAKSPAPETEPYAGQQLLCSICPSENACEISCDCVTGECTDEQSRYISSGYYTAAGRPVSANYCAGCQNKRCNRMWWCRS